MIDLHGHYLPGVDDGAPDLQTSLAMLRLAAGDGIAVVAATPHVGNSLSTLKGLDALRGAWQRWRGELEKSGLPLRVVGGAELYFTSDLLALLQDHRDLLAINGGSYFLLEFPADYIYAHSKEYVFKILTAGFIPIISHAERNQEIQRSQSILVELVKAGALCQVNAGSLRGDFGNASRRTAYELLRRNLVHVIASDAHDLADRRPGLSYVPALLSGVDAEKIDLYVNGIPAAIIADEAVPDIGEPEARPARRSFLGFLGRREP